MESEIVNITKIKDGYFLGDEATAANLDVIFQFKITHMVNAAGPQILNAWENIGTKYLTLNWTESPNQNLFDPKDEIANRIVGFIDDSFKSGEGFLVHSVRGQNRACLVVLIYFIRKYRWTLKKSMEFLSSKKNDIDIPSYFINQLNNFETRLTKSGFGPKSATWNEVGTGLPNDIDNEEVLIKNTYLNGIVNSSIDDLLIFKSGQLKKFTGRKMVWSDQTEKRTLLASSNKKDLLLQNPKEMKPVLNHKKMKPVKSSMKFSNQESQQQPSTNISSSYINPSFIRPMTASSNYQKSDNKIIDQSPSVDQRVNKFGSNLGSQSSGDAIITNNYLMSQTQQFSTGSKNIDQGIKTLDSKQSQVEQLPISGIKVPNHSFLRDSSIKRDKYNSLSHTSKQQAPTNSTNYYDYYTNNMKPISKTDGSNKVDNLNKQLIDRNNPNSNQQRPSTADNNRSSNTIIGTNYGIDFKDTSNSGKIIISPQVQNIVNTNIYIQQDDVRKIMGSFGLNQPNSNYGGNQSQQNQPLSKMNKNPENQRVLNNDYFNSSSNPNPQSFLSNTKVKSDYENKAESVSNNIFRVDQNNNNYASKVGISGDNLKKNTSTKSTGKVFLSGQNAGGNSILDSSIKKNFVGIRPQVSAGPVKLQTNDYFKKPMTPDTSNIGQPSK